MIPTKPKPDIYHALATDLVQDCYMARVAGKNPLDVEAYMARVAQAVRQMVKREAAVLSATLSTKDLQAEIERLKEDRDQWSKKAKRAIATLASIHAHNQRDKDSARKRKSYVPKPKPEPVYRAASTVRAKFSDMPTRAELAQQSTAEEIAQIMATHPDMIRSEG